MTDNTVTNSTVFNDNVFGVVNGKVGDGQTSSGSVDVPSAKVGTPQNLGGTEGKVVPEFTGNIGAGGTVEPQSGGGGSSRWADAEGAGSASGGAAEFEDLATVRRFAQEVVSLGEGSDFVQVIRACEALHEMIRDFGGDMNREVRQFVEAATRVARDGEALRDQAAQVAGLATDLSGD
jgi:hypothetical protein